VIFRDSGGPDTYQPNENYKCVFDAGVGETWSLQFVTFEFDHTTSRMYDRFGIQESTDGSTWSNIVVAWMHKSKVITAPWGPEKLYYIDGWIVPKDVTTANVGGYVSIFIMFHLLRLWHQLLG